MVYNEQIMIKDYIQAIKKEEIRNANFLHLTANESRMSETARTFLGSQLSERYFSGAGTNDIVDFGTFTQLGFQAIGELMSEAERAAKKMLGAEIVNLHCLSGMHAMMCAILATTKPGDIVMTLDPTYEGHFATTGILNQNGRKNIYASHDVKKQNINIEMTVMNFKKHKATALYLDPMYYVHPYDIRQLRKSLGEDAIIIYDASHTVGLIMGQQFQNPLNEGADVLCANTHKTLPGPQKGLVAFKNKKLGEVGNAIVQGCISNSHTHHLISLAITILEMEQFGEEYAKQVIANSNHLGVAFESLGYEVRKIAENKFSSNHQVHVFIDTLGDRLDLYSKLIQNNISTNFAKPQNSRLYVRLGTQEITRRGMKKDDMFKIAALVDRSFKGESTKTDVINFNKKFTKVLYSFDQGK